MCFSWKIPWYHIFSAARTLTEKVPGMMRFHEHLSHPLHSQFAAPSWPWRLQSTGHRFQNCHLQQNQEMNRDQNSKDATTSVGLAQVIKLKQVKPFKVCVFPGEALCQSALIVLPQNSSSSSFSLTCYWRFATCRAGSTTYQEQGSSSKK